MRPNIGLQKTWSVCSQFWITYTQHFIYASKNPWVILYYSEIQTCLMPLYLNNNHFVNWQLVIDGLDWMGWYEDKVLCLGDVFKETLNSYTGYLIYHSISTIQHEWQRISHTSAGMHILILWVFSWLNAVSIPWWPSIACSPIGQKWYNCESISIPLLVSRNNSDSLLVFCYQKLHSTFSSCFAVEVALSFS